MSCTPADLNFAARSFAEIPSGRIQGVIAYLLCQIASASNPGMSCDPNELARQAKCFCGLSTQQITWIQTYLLCQILENGGGGGQSCLLCGTEDPSAVPECECAIYYNITLEEFWYWNGAMWKPFIVQP